MSPSDANSFSGLPVLRSPERVETALSAIDLGHELRELCAGEGLRGCNISFDGESLFAAGGFSTRLARVSSGSTPRSNEDIEASECFRAIGKLARYTPRAVFEHVTPPDRLMRSWVCRLATWHGSDSRSVPGVRRSTRQQRQNACREEAKKAGYLTCHAMPHR
jgi:hypothetical protein